MLILGTVPQENTEVGLYEARPDGVHLSRLGSLAAAARLIEEFEKKPPSCEAAPKGDRLRPSDPGAAGAVRDAR